MAHRLPRPAHLRTPALRAVRAAVAVLTAVAAVVALPAATGLASAGAATCAVTWGSLAKSAGTPLPGRVTGVRAGRHACYDRLVVDLTGRAPGYDVRYVTTVRTEGGGFPVPVAGGARLAVVVKKGATSTPSMPRSPATRPSARCGGPGRSRATPPWRSACGPGCRSGSSRSTTRATNRSRLVVDVAHHW